MANSPLPQRIKAEAFYLTTKNCHSNNLGRPVISSVTLHKISEFVDTFLQPAVTNLKSYVKDATGFTKN